MKTELEATKAVVAEIARHLDVNLCLQLWDGTVIPLGTQAQDDIRLVIASPKVLRRLLTGFTFVNIAELYAAGDLDVVGSDLVEATRRVDHLQFRALPRRVNKARLFKAALPILIKSHSAASLVKRVGKKVGLSPGNGRDDRELIKFHYDLSNDFYALFLGEEMVYSAGYFASPTDTLDEGQRGKLDLICRKLRLAPGDRLFDPGCGWGGLTCLAAEKYGAIVHGTTLSQEQYDYVTAKVARLGLQDRVTVELRDCRALPDDMIFDKIAQVEMIEHVGIANHHGFYHYMRRHLHLRGLYYGQASQRRQTPNPDDFPKLTPYMKFIVEYIFPGGELDHIGMTTAALERAGFEVHEVEAMREHYGITAGHWARNLHARMDEGAALVGMPQTRVWLLYLSLVALAFQRGALQCFGVLASNRVNAASGIGFDRETRYGGK